MDWVLLAQAGSLVGCIVDHCIWILLALPFILFQNIGFRRCKRAEEKPGSVTFYEGSVLHVRRAPVRNHFKYAVRMAVLDLDDPPTWFEGQPADHMTADEARKFASTQGPVKLLTSPMSAGYVMNPISIYYCYGRPENGAAPRLERCIAEVTNTPWNERVSFVFAPDGQSVRKALHVSPLMDMQNTWHLHAPEPSDRLKLVVRASHPQHGDYFHADLLAARCSAAPACRNEEAGLRALLRYGFMPHRVAALIYWQAVKLLAKGVPFYPPPSKAYQLELLAEGAQPAPACPAAPAPGGDTHAGAAAAGASGCGACPGSGGAAGGAGGLCPVAGAGSWGAAQHSHPRNGLDGRHFKWRSAPGWPWRED